MSDAATRARAQRAGSVEQLGRSPSQAQATPNAGGADRLAVTSHELHRCGWYAVVRAQLAMLCAACACSAAVAAAASASSASVLSDCNEHAQLTQQYSAGDLQEALSTMGADQKHTDCYDVIQRALLADVGRLHPGTVNSQQSGSSSFLTAPVIISIGVAASAGAAVALLGARRRRK
jgi:hypothetical protein